jgi:sugar phosphate isomerase/epimerase
MARVPVALQLYSVRDDAAADLAGTLKAVAAMGYEGVEFAGYFDKPAAELRKMLDDLGLKVAGSHARAEEWSPENLQQTTDFHHILGNTFLINPWHKEETKEGWLAFAESLNTAAAALLPAGLFAGYHNHAHEMAEIDGTRIWDLLAASTRPEVVLQLDLGHARRGGVDPLAYYNKYLGRGRTIHLKEYCATDDKPLLGKGDLDWPAILDSVEAGGKTEWYIVEQEVYPIPPMEAAKHCREYLKSIGR